jgi:hypothetical protein
VAVRKKKTTEDTEKHGGRKIFYIPSVKLRGYSVVNLLRLKEEKEERKAEGGIL